MAAISIDETAIATWRIVEVLSRDLVQSEEIHLWQRRRPEYWWGVAWLPEFWLTVVLGIGLIVSVWRDSRNLRHP